MEVKKKTPTIRFEGYDTEWETKKLGEIGTTYTGLSGKTKDDFGKGDGRFVPYMNVFTNPLTSSKQLEKVGIDEKQNEVKKGDVFFTTSSETPGEVGMSSVWLHDIKNVYLNSFCFAYRPAINIESYYLAYLLRSSEIRKQFSFLAQGISRYNISKGKAMEISIPLPSNSEQSKIGNYFKELDELIRLQEQKHEKLLNLKKAMLDKMFPKDGADVPEIRFKGFTEKWEKKKLGDISSSYSGGTPSVSVRNYYGGPIPFIRSGEINKSSTELFITEEGLNNSSAKLVKKGYLLYALYGATSGEVSVSKIDGAINQAVLAIIPQEGYNILFLENWLRLSKEKIVSTFLQGGQGNLSGSIVKNLIFCCPAFQEQQKIGVYFENLDKLIAQSKEQITKYKNIKQALLQKMFV